MFNLFFWGLLSYFIILIGLKTIKWFYRLRKNKIKYHYFIIVKNGQGMIEWVIRSLTFDNWVEGREQQITVIDLGSDDDSLAILERLTHQKSEINNLYTIDPEQIELLDSLLEKSRKRDEEPVVLHINTDVRYHTEARGQRPDWKEPAK